MQEVKKAVVVTERGAVLIIYGQTIETPDGDVYLINSFDYNIVIFGEKKLPRLSRDWTWR